MRIMQKYAHIKRKGGNMINIRLRKCVTRARISQSRRRKPLIADLRRCCRHWIARKKAANIFRDLHLSTHDVSRNATSAKSCKSPRDMCKYETKITVLSSRVKDTFQRAWMHNTCIESRTYNSVQCQRHEDVFIADSIGKMPWLRACA